MNTGGLIAPADVQTIDEAGIASSIRGTQSHAPTWGVSDPVATALSGLATTLKKYSDTYDDVMVNDYTMQKSKELDELYNNPDTGIFNTRKGEDAKGMYQDYKSTIRDIWDKDAMEKLTPRQRELASKNLYHLFSDYGHRVAAFETKQLMGAQQERCENAVYNAQQVIGTGWATDNDIANGMNAIRVGMQTLGEMNGWDAETIKRKQMDAMSEALTKASATLAASDPIAALGLLNANRSFMSHTAYAGAVQALDGKLNSVYQEEYIRRLVAGDKEGADRWLREHSAVPTGGARGDRVARFESSGQGVRAIGYDGNGGTSYGKYQLSSKQGSYQEWLDYLSKQGEEGAAIAGRLRNAGPLNTGSKSGAAVAAYQKEALASPALFERTQREYIEKHHYNPMLSKLPADERAMIEGNAALQEMAWSVAVQHGGSGGASLLRRAWKPGMTMENLVDAVYGIRGGYFGSSTKAVQNAVQRRFGDEKELIHGMLRDEYRPVPGALKPSQVVNIQSRGRTMIDKVHVDKAYEVLVGMDRNEAKEKLLSVEGQAELGLDSEQAATLWRKISPYWNTLAKQERDKNVGDIMEAVRGLPLNERDNKALELLDQQFPDETERATALAEYVKRTKREDKMQQAASWEKMKPVVNQGLQQGKTKLQVLNEILENPNFTDHEKTAASNALTKSPKENDASRKVMGRIMREGNRLLQQGDDAKDVMSWAEAEAFGNLTQAQTKKVLSYFEKGGNVAGVTFSRCESMYKHLLGARGKHSKDVHLPDLAFALILDNLNPDETSYTDEKLGKLIAEIMIDEYRNMNPIWNTKTTIFEAVKGEYTDDLMETNEDKIRAAEDEYKRRFGRVPTRDQAAMMAFELEHPRIRFNGRRTANASR